MSLAVTFFSYIYVEVYIFFLLWYRVSFCGQAGLEFESLLPQPPPGLGLQAWHVLCDTLLRRQG